MLSTLNLNAIATIAAVISALAAVVAVGVAYYTFVRTLRATLRPILVFSLTPEMVWQVRNVGPGPAIGVTVGDKWLDDDWHAVVTCQALSSGASTSLPWIHEGAEIACVYRDVFEQVQTTTCVSGSNSVVAGDKCAGWSPNWTEWELLALNDPDLLLYREEDLQDKTALELDILRNEFYARHGYKFDRQDLSEYFSAQPWYEPTTDDQVEINKQLTRKERNTALFILYYQNRHNRRNRPVSLSK